MLVHVLFHASIAVEDLYHCLCYLASLLVVYFWVFLLFAYFSVLVHFLLVLYVWFSEVAWAWAHRIRINLVKHRSIISGFGKIFVQFIWKRILGFIKIWSIPIVFETWGVIWAWWRCVAHGVLGMNIFHRRIFQDQFILSKIEDSNYFIVLSLSFTSDITICTVVNCLSMSSIDHAIINYEAQYC